ncbi:MAG: hypothetical protein IKR80_01765 [Spirochaetales bacterium]|nr:hypothetical protein [Spirochaetales bacterium]
MQLDEQYFRESFKGISFRGLRLSQMEDPIRAAYHRGSKAAMNGLSPEQICVMTGVNDTREFFYDPCCRSRPTTAITIEVLRDRVCSGAIVNTDRLNSYARAMAELDVAAHNRFIPAFHGGLNDVNSLHSSIRLFLKRFKGVSTKWLCHYVFWMKWIRSFKRGRMAEGYKAIATRHLVQGNYRFRVRTLSSMPIPFRDGGCVR